MYVILYTANKSACCFCTANFIQKERKNKCFGTCNIYNEETTFYSCKAMFFFASGYWHIHRFLCFRKGEDQNVQR